MTPLRTSPSLRKVRLANQRGQTLVEYALILAFVAVVAIAVLMAMGTNVKKTFASVNTQLSTAKNGGAADQN